jgi:hypothetical protein
MDMAGSADRPRASRWETLGARLGIWTLPVGVDDPPPIRRRTIVLGVAGLVAVLVVLVVVVIPAIDDSKDAGAARERREDAAFVRRERARLSAEQAARFGRAVASARLHAAGDDGAARTALVGAVRADVLRDARARVVAGKLDGPIRGVRCTPSVDDGGGVRVHLDCLAITSAPAAAAGSGSPAGSPATAGHPFLVSGSLRDGRYAWCKMNAPPGEGASATGVFVALPDDCTR